ncbi:MAG: XdhC family protein [Actinobacteria bacterium]|nr:MAG: XdhC family protein [Actinomycetota bacterium]
MRELSDDLDRWRARGERVALARVVATRRSAPRPVGAKLAISESGELAGSVSGGCVESEVVDAAREILRGDPPRLLTFGISDDLALSVATHRERRRARGGPHRSGERVDARPARGRRRAGRPADSRWAQPRRRDRESARVRRRVRAAAAAVRLRRRRHGRGARRRCALDRVADDRRGRAREIRDPGPRSERRRAARRVAGGSARACTP